MNNKKQVAVVIPIYKTELNDIEMISLKQAIRILEKYDMYFAMPDTLELNIYNDTIRREKFDSSFFTSIASYNKLMMDVEFYERFREYEYILIYQLDAFVFSDQLEYFCGLGYDYMGAPWVSGTFCYIDRQHCIWNVGNGGFSLRKVEKTINILRTGIRYFGNSKINEDIYFASSDGEKYSVAPMDIALKFSFEMEVRKCYRLNNNRLPFGCHAWAKYDLRFWKSYIEACGYQVNDEWMLHGVVDEVNSKEYDMQRIFTKFWRREYKVEMLKTSLGNVLSDLNRHLAIFGSGFWGNCLCTMLNDAGIKVEYFIDNNLNLKHKIIHGVEIVGVDDLETNKFNIIVAIKGKNWEICEQLNKKGYEYKKNYAMIQDIAVIEDNVIIR